MNVGVIQVVEKLDKVCVLHLTPPDNEMFRLIVQPDVSGSLAAYANFVRTQWLETYRIESQNANQIGLELELPHLLKAYVPSSSAHT